MTMGMMLYRVILIVLVVYELISLMKRMGPPGSSGPTKRPPAQKTALKILEEMYARGAIKEEMGTLFEIGLRRQITPLALVTFCLGADSTMPCLNIA